MRTRNEILAEADRLLTVIVEQKSEPDETRADIAVVEMFLKLAQELRLGGAPDKPAKKKLPPPGVLR